MSQLPQIVTIAQADQQHPRQAGAGLIELQDASLMIAWMEISSSQFLAGDDAPSNICTMRSHDGGQTWGEYSTLIERGPDDTAAYKPCFLRLQDGEILFRYEMYHKFVMNQPRCVSSYICKSSDECKTFSDPMTVFNRSEHLTGSMNDIRQLRSGRIIIPTDHMTGMALQNEGEGLAPTDVGMSGCMYSDDNGANWKESDNYVYLPMRGTGEPKIEELHDGRLIMMLRTQLGSVFKSYSHDSGQTWTNPQTTGLTAPESCTGLIRIPQSGDLLLVWNHAQYKPRFDHYGLRNPLTVAVSKDDADTWPIIKNVRVDPKWEFTNPAPMVTSDGKLLIPHEASKYENLENPGKLGRSCMPLDMVITDLDWLYK